MLSARLRPRAPARLPSLTAGVVIAALLGPGSGVTASLAAQEPSQGGAIVWRPLFNGKDLSGWTPKITGYEPGQDPLGTFRVEDGLLTVSYEAYGDFDARFGHLFYETPFSEYALRIEYRFIGEQAKGGPGWALRNSGVMFHAQAPGTMLRDQDFPISLEAQFLGGNGRDDRPTMNLCTPGTHVEIGGTLEQRHCITADAPTFHGDEWVTVELVVRGGGSIAHVIAGDTVLAYANPVIGGGVVEEFDPGVKIDGTPLDGGYIALQSESHPIQFRGVWIRELESAPTTRTSSSEASPPPTTR